MDHLGDRRYIVPVRIRTMLFGVCIRKKTIFIKVEAATRSKAAIKAIADVRDKFDDEIQTAEILAPLLDIELMALVSGAKIKKKENWWRRLWRKWRHPD